MARIEQLDLLNEVVISHDDDDDFKLWFTIITVRESGMKFVPPPDKHVEFRIHCTFDEAKQIYGIMIGTILQLSRDTGGMPKEKWKDVCIYLPVPWQDQGWLLRTGGFRGWLRCARRAQRLQPALRRTEYLW